MEKNISIALIQRISKAIPPYIKLVDYLMDSLNLGREAAYRRMRNQVPFTIDEIAQLATNLHFSLDEVIGNNKRGNIMVKSFDVDESNPGQIFHTILNDHYNTLLKVVDSGGIDTVLSTNQLLFISTIQHQHLLRFFYYKWVQQIYDVPLNFYYSDVEIPADITELREKIRKIQLPSGSFTLIIDQNLFLSTIKGIYYYYKRRLLNEEELRLISGDLLALINQAELLAQKGVSDKGTQFHWYLSTLNIESNLMCVEYGDTREAYFFGNSINPLLITDPGLCMLQKKWLESLKKFSTLISCSNEILQSDFFNRQREYLDSLENGKYDLLLKR